MQMMKTRKNRTKGFTLVELIVVIAIIAVLSIVAVVAYSNISSQAETAAVNSDANTVIRALNTYNALIPSGQITANTNVTVRALEDLKLTSAAGGVDMQLGVFITAERLAKVMDKINYDTTAKMWVLGPVTAPTTTTS